MRKKILTVAKNYQKLSRQVKDLEAKMKPIKADLGDKESKASLASEFEELGELKLDEKACAEAFAKNNRLKKRMKTLGLSVVEKESFAVYAG